MQLKSVVFPAPFGPMRPTISPLPMVNDTSLLAMRPPNRLVTARSSRRVDMGSGGATEPSAPRQRQESGRPESGDEDDDEAGHDEVDAAAGQRPRAEHGAHGLG